jgi:hypothetical protein
LLALLDARRRRFADDKEEACIKAFFCNSIPETLNPKRKNPVP